MYFTPFTTNGATLGFSSTTTFNGCFVASPEPLKFMAQSYAATFAPNYRIITVSQSATNDTISLYTNAGPFSNSFIGVASTSATIGNPVTVTLRGGVTSNLSGLVTGLTYYLDPATGAITTSVTPMDPATGAITTSVTPMEFGIALSTTTLLMHGV
jgi:hypothetical protein